MNMYGPKSHGTFDGITPMDSDVHNLKPADASVNQSRSNKDFDNGGTQHPEATDCYFTADTWEPRDAAKGDIARIIFICQHAMKAKMVSSTWKLLTDKHLSNTNTWSLIYPVGMEYAGSAR